MSERHTIPLRGCNPEPLMSYLKALGILRLVSEQADPEATGWWRNETFVLESALDEAQLLEFFQKTYEPAPIIGPWAGKSGFFEGDDRTAVEAISASDSSRLTRYRRTIECAIEILEGEGITQKPTDTAKQHLLKRYRSKMPDEFIRWMDAVMVLQSQGQVFAPILGTGGNDGRLDFTRNFMQRVIALGFTESEVESRRPELLVLSLLGMPTKGLARASVGQFSPGRAGGPNATQGMEGVSQDNPWDFVLMIEGALMLAGSVVRRMGVNSSDKAAFPFTVRSRAASNGAGCDEESSAARGELWLPLWNRPVRLNELEGLFSEGRAESAGRPARDTIDFARSIAGLGVDRGVLSFARYGFFKRSGKAFLATPIERFRVPAARLSFVDRLTELSGWIDGFRRAASTDGTSQRFRSALSRLDLAIYDYCRSGSPNELCALLVALGRAERELAVTAGQRGGKQIVPPIQGLSTEWIAAAHNSSAEFTLALSLSGMYGRGTEVQPLRSNLESTVFEFGLWQWRESNRDTVWLAGDLAANMARVLERRLLSGERARGVGAALAFRRAVGIDIIATFLAGRTYDRHIEELLWGLMLVDHREPYSQSLPKTVVTNAASLPRAYALLKLLFLPHPLVCEWHAATGISSWRRAVHGEPGIVIRSEPRILPLLRANRLSEACQIAHRRLRVSGLNPMPGRTAGGRQFEWEVGDSVSGERLAASLLIPISDASVNHLIRMVVREEQSTGPSTFGNKGVLQS